jgi:hypothetical protein
MNTMYCTMCDGWNHKVYLVYLQCTICDVYCDTYYIRMSHTKKHAVLYIVMDEITKFNLIDDYNVQ